MYTAEEDVVNSATHFLSGVCSILAVLLIVFNIETSLSNQVSFFLISFTGAWTFFSSYMYHSSRTSPKRTRNQLLDKMSIYIMIGGNGAGISMLSSSTTFALVSSILLIGLSCGLAANLCIKKKVSETFAISSYILLGWLAILPASGLIVPSNFTELPQLLCLLGGGAAYSIGVGFYIDERKWYHCIWHACTMIGFSLHFAACFLCL